MRPGGGPGAFATTPRPSRPHRTENRGRTLNQEEAYTRVRPQEVLEFWFGDPPGKSRAEWFRKDAAFDEEIRRRFGELHAAAARRSLESWRASPEPMLALIVVLDQFSRN